MWSCEEALETLKTRLLRCLQASRLLCGSWGCMMTIWPEMGTGAAAGTKAVLPSGSLAAACSSKKLTRFGSTPRFLSLALSLGPRRLMPLALPFPRRQTFNRGQRCAPNSAQLTRCLSTAPNAIAVG